MSDPQEQHTNNVAFGLTPHGYLLTFRGTRNDGKQSSFKSCPLAFRSSRNGLQSPLENNTGEIGGMGWTKGVTGRAMLVGNYGILSLRSVESPRVLAKFTNSSLDLSYVLTHCK
ncbi:MAG TPA: hypothetical protein DDW52_29840 [Planctomycetaceae bacterium]|nr:hypothetical protein [Planctomycetaceae bacterium]